MSETGRFYSSIRRIPTTLHRLPDGTRVPGGPYTLVQGMGGATAIALLWAVRGTWSTGLIVADIGTALVVGLGVVWLFRYAPDNINELFMLVTGSFMAVAKPGHGRYEDQALSFGRAPRGMPEAPARTSSAPHPSAGRSATSPAEPAPTYRPLGTSSVARLLQQTPHDPKDLA